MKNILKSFLFSLIIISFIPACGENDYQEPGDDETGSISFNVEWTGAPSLVEEASLFTRALDCQASNIDIVTFEIVDSYDRRLARDSWACIAGEGTVYGVPAGTDRKLIVEGKDDQNRALYRGEIEGIVVTAGKHTDVETVTCDPVEIIDYAYLQYRTFADGRDPEYRGWIDFTKEGNPIELFDIPQVSLKNPSGNTVSVSKKTFYSFASYYGEWNDSTSSVEFTDLFIDSGFTIEFPIGTSLPPGDYTYEATTSQETQITITLFFPGETVLPTVDVSSMNHEWQGDSSLYLSWANPSGDYDKLRIVILDQFYNEILYVTLPADMNDLMVPADIIQNLTDLTQMNSASWVVQTRSYTNDNNNYARGYSMSAVIPSWQP